MYWRGTVQYNTQSSLPACSCAILWHRSFVSPPSPYPSFTYSTLTIRSDPIWNNSFGCWGERIRNKARGVTLTHTTRRRELSIYIQIRTGQNSCNIKKRGTTTPSLLSAVEPTLPFIISSDKAAFKQPRNENVNQESINHRHRVTDYCCFSPTFPFFSSSLISIPIALSYFFIFLIN